MITELTGFWVPLVFCVPDCAIHAGQGMELKQHNLPAFPLFSGSDFPVPRDECLLR